MKLPTAGFCRSGVLVLVAASVCLVDPLASLAADETADAEYLPGTPFTYLFDTGNSSPRPLSARALAGKDGWTLVPEDNTEHRFQGDAVLLNDKLSVVLRRKGPGAEVYSKTPAGPRFRAVVMAADRKAVAVSGTSSVEIEENNPGAVELTATFQTDGPTGRSTAGYRLTTGQAMLELTCGEGADRLFVWCKTRYCVVPDFFGHDMVFTPAVCDLPRFGLPTENFVLNLIEGGDAIVMCVWPSAEQEAHAILTGEGTERVVRGCEIRGGPEKNLSVAFLEAAGIWHEAKPRDDDWKPPFDAKWRVNRLTSGPWTVSSDLSQSELETVLVRPIPRPQRPDPADRFLPRRRHPKHARRRPLPVRPPDRGPGFGRQPHARPRDELGRRAVRQEQAKLSGRRDPGPARRDDRSRQPRPGKDRPIRRLGPRAQIAPEGQRGKRPTVRCRPIVE